MQARQTVLGCMAVMLIAGISHGAVLMHTDSIPLQPTDWDETLTFPKFDPALGTLNKVKFTLTGGVEGTAQYESLDSEPATITLDLSAEIELQRPDLSTLLIALPVVQVVENAAADDGTIDFDGPAGSTFGGLQAAQMEMTTTTDAGDLALFTGLGDIMLPVNASGASAGSGAGNLVLQFMTDAEASVKVEYGFTIIPTPATLPMLMVAALGLFRRTRQAV